MEALALVIAFDGDLQEIILLSIQVSFTAVVLSALVGLPVGAWLAITDSRLRPVLVMLTTAMMGLPPVVVGLVVYLLLSNAGVLGPLQLLYTPTAMIIAQSILVTPIVTALTRETIANLHDQYADQLNLLGVSGMRRMRTLLWEGRHGLLTALLAGFGRAIAEVGAVIMVGGNINHVTRVMTTTIALETSKGNLSLALGLGIVLVVLAMVVNAAVLGLGSYMRRQEGGFHG
ncbi:Tungstate uptake system permease protein TupB [Granulosicoccus antarcticus IMCC3135]|uniref:Tungstate uptake system permease protein TupB n=2 Tax=Granulosicoccus TaxID=437504 RepID=A0A2Z2NMH1_9GAMM|nr:Tungstate uptake system permease protein TupB [Granulosicoccus antarcticus IMCC3135]